MMITNLPMDLMEDILSRVPLKSTRAVRLTCTKWNTLSKSQIFTKMHLGKAFAPPKEDDDSESHMIVMSKENLSLMSVFVNNEVDLSAEHIGNLTCLDEQVKISNVFNCEGLLLCILEDDATRVAVWNPYLGQTRWIQLRDPHVLCGVAELRNRLIYASGTSYQYWGRFSYGIGYEDKRCGRNYKILRFIDLSLFEEGNKFFWYEVYDFESGLWTTLDVVDPYWRITSRCGVSVKGNSYWCARERDAQANDFGWGEQGDHIICFDYTRMRFGPLLPLPYGIRSGRATLSCLREEKLVAHFDQPFPYGLSIWITTMLEAEKVSWSHFTLSSYDEYSILDDIHIRLSFGGFYEEKKVSMFSGQRLNCHLLNHIGGDGFGADYIERKLPAVEDRVWRKCVCFYVPSLVQVKQPKGGQSGKKQSDVEKLRYDVMMSRLSYFERRCKRLDLELAKKKASTCTKTS